MQILINLPDAQVKALLHRADEQGVTSSELISKALEKALEPAVAREGDDWISQYAGLWARTNPDGIVDGQEYQDELRSEWER